MENLYGYKEKDVLGLINALKNHKGTLSLAFKSYAKTCGKSVGTIRNLYYKLVKTSKSNKEFCDKYLNGKPINSNQIVFFKGDEDKKMIKDVLLLKSEGYSVRRAIFNLTKGDEKLALRYQNKFRSVKKDNPKLYNSVIEEIKREKPSVNLSLIEDKLPTEYDFKLKRLKEEINFLYDSLIKSVKKENQILRQKNRSLMLENARLLDKNIQKTTKNTALEYFKRENSEDANG